MAPPSPESPSGVPARDRAVAFAFVAAWAWLAIRSRAPEGASLVEFAVVVGISVVAAAFASLGPRPAARRLVLAAAVVAHGVAVLGEPILEDDPARYLWDGYVFAERGSPYGIAPSAWFEDDSLPPAWQEILSDVNHPELPTIYGPAQQWLHRAALAVAPGEVWPLQLAAALASVALVLGLAPLVAPRVLPWLAWSPLLLKEGALTAHHDVLGVHAIVGASRVLDARPFAAGVLLALAIGIKPFAALAVPFLLWRSPAGVAGCGLASLALVLPFAGSDLGADSLAAMARGGWFNAPVQLAAVELVTPGLVQAACAIALALGVAWFGWQEVRGVRAPASLPRGDLWFGWMLLWSPVLNPWYAIWPLAFAAVHPTRTAWVASVALLGSYAHGLQLGAPSLGPYEIPVWASWLQFAPIAVAFAWDWRRPLRVSSRGRGEAGAACRGSGPAPAGPSWEGATRSGAIPRRR